MQHKRDIRPITYLKNNTADLIREVSDNGRTVLITQNGEAKAVVMDVELYDRWKASLAMLKILAQSEAEFEAGQGRVPKGRVRSRRSRHPPDRAR